MIKLKGEDYPFLFANKANREMSSNEDLVKKDDIYFIYLGFKYGSKRENKEFPFTEEALEDIFEDDLEAYEKAAIQLGEDMGKLKKIKALAMKSIQI